MIQLNFRPGPFEIARIDRIFGQHQAEAEMFDVMPGKLVQWFAPFVTFEIPPKIKRKCGSIAPHFRSEFEPNSQIRQPSRISGWMNWAASETFVTLPVAGS